MQLNNFPFSSTEHQWVKTALYERLKAALSNGISPLFVTGPPGSGKTTLLRLLEHDWSRSGKLACLITLRSIYQETDLFSLLQHHLLGSEAIPQIERLVIRSSGSEALHSLVDLIRSLPSKPLLLLDGLDETLNPQLILRFVRLISENTSTLVVVTGRTPLPDSASARVFNHILTTEALTRSEMMELLKSAIPWLELDEAQANELYEATQGSAVLGMVFVRGLEKFTPSELADALRMRFPHEGFLLRTFVTRALDRAGVTTDQSILRLLTVIALRGPLSRSELETFGFSIPDSLASSGVLFISDNTVSLSHKALSNEVLATAGVLPASGTKLRDLQFGAEEAERDKLLGNNFIQLPGYTDLILGETNIVVGDRGSGKSAMFCQLPENKRSTPSGQFVQVIRLTHPMDMLKKLETNGSELRSADEFRAGWLTLAAHSLAANMTTFSSDTQKRAAARFREALNEDNEASDSFLEWILKRLRGTSIKIKLGPVLLESAAIASKGRQRGAVIDLSAFIREAAKTLNNAGQMVIIAVDRIDEIHKYDRALQEKAVQGLFLAESDLAQIAGVNFLIFIRSDLFKIYDIQEKNKLVSRTLEIEWNRQDLLKFLVHRVLSNTCLAGLKTFVEQLPAMGDDLATQAIFPSRIEDTPAVEWLWDCMANGNGHISPRQLILLLVLAVKFPPAQGLELNAFPIFPAVALQWAMDKLSELSFKELVDDFRVARTFLSNCRAGKISSFGLTSVSTFFSEADGAISVQIAQLERLGFLERVVVASRDGKQSPEFRVPKLFTRGWATG